jgi:hypothetical protein
MIVKIESATIWVVAQYLNQIHCIVDLGALEDIKFDMEM